MKLALNPLEEHPDRIRIQKLLYFAYSQLWVSDFKALNGMTISHILQQLLAETPAIDQLQFRLIESAEKLNKPDKYIQLANTVIETLKKSVSSSTAQEPKSDRFKLRFALMQVINPYKAKAVLLALYQQKSTVGTSESHFNTYSLDELLRKVQQYFPTVPELEKGLLRIQALPGGVLEEEKEQLLQTVLEALRPHIRDGNETSHNLAIAPEPLEEVDLSIDSDSICTILVAPDKLPATSSKAS